MSKIKHENNGNCHCNAILGIRPLTINVYLTGKIYIPFSCDNDILLYKVLNGDASPLGTKLFILHAVTKLLT
jgi:hypothetical protein